MRFRQACLSGTHLTSFGANLVGRSDVLVVVAEGALNITCNYVINVVLFVCLFVCFPGVTTHCGCTFTAPVTGFSLLVFEVS